MGKRSVFLVSVLVFGFAFLYVPILIMIGYSFNSSRLATLWGGFSLKWYPELFQNDQVISAALLSLRIAIVSATVATLFGTLAGLALARMGRFRGRTLFSGMISAPLIMPDVITGLSLLFLFVILESLTGWPPGRGATTITLAHITFSMAYVAIIVQSRLTSMDSAIEEAAMDLGSTPFRVIFDITLPIIAPAMVAGWLLSFTLSLDDLVIATFTAGPGSTTLPMLIFSKVKLGMTPDINALATIIIGIVAVGVSIAGFTMHRAEKRREKDIQLAIAANK